jgi:uncharacterized repeat protein (TIGR03803 family)
MKRLVNALSKLNRIVRAGAVIALYLIPATGLPAQTTFTSLYSFCSLNCADGEYPVAALVQVPNGNLYGTTYHGGSHGFGTVFEITPSGTLTTRHSFRGELKDGEYPAGLIQAADGNVYGITRGGANNSGLIFKITPSGTLVTLYRFCSQLNCADGESPSGLVQAIDGDFYGTASGGANNNAGTVFKITPSGTLTTLYSFCSQSLCTDGEYVQAGLVQATDGDFYGTTSGAGTPGNGTVFKITPSGTLTTLHSFDGADGSDPYAGLVQATDGNFYGTTSSGGVNGRGTVFSLSVGLGPFVETLPTAGRVGAKVILLGTTLTGASSVTFNGAAATFTVNSTGTAIATRVPAGATTGTVQVVTPGGMLSSNVPFLVP